MDPADRGLWRGAGPALRWGLIAAVTAVTLAPLGSQDRAGYRLVWEDEFNSRSLDRKKWNVESGYGLWGNGELEEYRSRGNLSLVDGILVIEARKAGNRYLSARINTKGRFAFSHGRLEARMRLPRGNGLWPALWMMGGDVDTVGHPRCGEIDIVEMVGGKGGGLSDRVTYSSLHRPDSDAPSGLYSRTGSFEAGEDLAEGFHVFSMDWDERTISFQVDGEEYFRADISGKEDAIFHKDYFLILNLAVGGSWPGPPTAETEWPQRLYVDWIRVYRREG